MIPMSCPPIDDSTFVIAGRVAAGEDADEEHAVEAGHAVHGHRADRVVDAQPFSMKFPDQTATNAARDREQVRERRVVDVRARGDRDDAGEAAGQRPERVALAGEPAAGEPAGEADRDHERDRA